MLNLILECRDAVQMWFLSRNRRLDSSPATKRSNVSQEAAGGLELAAALMAVIACLLASSGLSAGAGKLVHAAASGAFIYVLLQQPTETSGCSAFKSFVCHLNEAFRAKKKKKKKQNKTWKYHNMLKICALNWDVLGICCLSFLDGYFSCILSDWLTTQRAPGLLFAKEKPWNWHYTLKFSTDLQEKHQQSANIAGKNKHMLLFLNPLINWSICLKPASFFKIK